MLNDPFYIVLLYTPLAFFQDFALVRGIWMLLSEAALVGTVLFAFNLSEWQPPRWLYVVLLGFGLFNYFSLNALFTGTPTVLLTFLYLWILIALRSHSDELAGASPAAGGLSMGSGRFILSFYSCLCLYEPSLECIGGIWHVTLCAACRFISGEFRVGTSIYSRSSF